MAHKRTYEIQYNSNDDYLAALTGTKHLTNTAAQEIFATWRDAGDLYDQDLVAATGESQTVLASATFASLEKCNEFYNALSAVSNDSDKAHYTIVDTIDETV